tara:strand:- start:89 stop:1435 length:1347 start_codon:yes stop_codon:yes gene_type:complete
MTKNIKNWLSENPLCNSVRAATCDLNGIWRGKRFPINQLDKLIGSGTRMPLSSSCVDIWGTDLLDSSFLFETGDSDGIALPTDRGFVPCLWLSRPTALIPLSIFTEDGNPSPIDPRHVLRRVCKAFQDENLQPSLAFEIEFYLLDSKSKNPIAPNLPITKERMSTTSVLSIDDMDEFEHFFSDVFKACELQGIPAETSISENAIGQFEVNLKYSDNPVKAADDAVLLKRLIKGIAKKHSFRATFMAKPFLLQSGSGMHLHFSVLDKSGKNIFDNGTPAGSTYLLNAVAGLIEFMKESTLIFAPNLNSYRRLAPDTHAPTGICWGYENRTTSIRIPGGENSSRRIEHRVAGADANPYLVAAAILSAALDGIKRKRIAPEPIAGDSYGCQTEKIPLDWQSAIDFFFKSGSMASFFPGQFSETFAKCKLQEFEKFRARMDSFELDTYLDST